MATIKVKRRNLIDSLPVLNKIKSEKLPIRTMYKIVSITKKVDEEAQLIRSSFVPDDEAKAFETERLNILQKYARKDENGQPITRGGFFDIPPENIIQATKELEELRQQKQEVADRLENMYRELNQFLDEEVEIEIETLKLEELENVCLSGDELLSVFYLIENNNFENKNNTSQSQ